MDFSPILNPVYQMLWYLVPLAILAAIFKSPWFKGLVGEFVVNMLLRRLDKTQYHLLRNVTLPTEDGTTQIDHIVVSPFGVFVLETKHMKGWIFGGERQASWTQKIYKHSSKFQNPLRQNYKHVKTLAGGLDIAELHIHSVVVFVGDSEFKTPMPPNVCRGGGCVRYIRSFQTPVLTPAEVTAAVQAIEQGRLKPSVKTHRAHVQHVRRRAADKAAEPRCPKCDGAMIQRVAKSGPNAGSPFWGCASFPRCRGTMPVGPAATDLSD